ncbi:hypothetical protein [Inmirania thermothiophila]|uniref:Uncharacterized protein n=1 Tax=Inmirania thermothiophila TaxID=1750597 RepID=A0A3N1Y1M2_9GAMM|nr:hypothetical protein [Inmirania thermothiophila]ROR32715.1 hypothetical protein EDC57_1926 [Inmirania thermothiophila]
MRDVRQVPLEEVPEGAELAAEVLDDEGRCLLGAGAFLGRDVIEGLARRGVRAVSIYVEAELDEAGLAARREAVAERVAHLFRGLPEDGAAGELRRAVLAYRQERLR